MTAKELNVKLLEFVPECKELFDSVTCWQNGLDTGSTIVVEDVFFVYLKDCIEKKNADGMEKCTAFVEWLSAYIDEEYAGDVLVISIFEYIHFASDRKELEKVLGPKAKELYLSIDWK